MNNVKLNLLLTASFDERLRTSKEVFKDEEGSVYNMAQPVDKSAGKTTKKKRLKVNELMRELEEERMKNANLTEKLNESHKKTTELQASLEQSTVDLSNGLSSTMRPASVTNAEESKFFSSMNQLCLASLNVPECKSTDEGDIHRQTFEQWRDLLLDNLGLAGIEDEKTMFMVFRVKAGSRLLEIFRNTVTQEGFADPDQAPFTNAMQRLRSYFGSGSDVMLMRRRLTMLFQKADETDLAFINRVGTIARMCEFDKNKEFEEIVGTVAEHARSKEVRSAALKMLSRKGSLTELIDKVREIEAIRLNEEYVTQKRGNVEAPQIAAVEPGGRWTVNHRQDHYNPQRYYSPPRHYNPQGRNNPGGHYGPQGHYDPRGYYNTNNYGYRQDQAQYIEQPFSRGNAYQRGQNYSRGNFSQRGHPSSRRGGQSPRYAVPFRGPEAKVEAQEARKDCCWRCGGQYHSPDSCGSINKICDNCGRRGHIKRACVVGGKRSAPEQLEVTPRKVAAVEKEEVEKADVSNETE